MAPPVLLWSASIPPFCGLRGDQRLCDIVGGPYGLVWGATRITDQREDLYTRHSSADGEVRSLLGEM